jgi:hypothetical protein
MVIIHAQIFAGVSSIPSFWNIFSKLEYIFFGNFNTKNLPAFQIAEAIFETHPGNLKRLRGLRFKNPVRDGNIIIAAATIKRTGSIDCRI